MVISCPKLITEVQGLTLTTIRKVAPSWGGGSLIIVVCTINHAADKTLLLATPSIGIEPPYHVKVAMHHRGYRTTVCCPKEIT